MVDKMYHITVGQARPATIKIGTIERNTGQSVIKERGETLNKRGDTGFPNGTKIWAARVIDGQIQKDASGQNPIQISVTDPRYKGEIKRLKWGTPGGALMDVRYIKGYPSLDVLYQERILNFKIDETNETSADVFMLMFPNGDNDIDESIDPLLVEHLKGHAYNRDSVSKDPQFHTYMFWEKSFEQEERLDTQGYDEKFEAGKMVRDVTSGADEMSKCKNLFSIVRAAADEEPEDTKLLGYLKMLAEKQPAQILKAVADYKLKVSNIFEKLKSHEALDLTIPGTIAVLKPKRELIASNIPGKGKAMLEYLLENFADPDVFDATYKLIKITDKIN